ncbi:hypothetical protein AURDEDRAFT_88482 [Auricularia subglabra TFB-10046 SS5]|nr:hypothetical protein AURDEDRAFT_88482 [Auricularia subglabra TFB-10046 SS5]
MIGTSAAEYVFIRVCIAALRLVAPLGFAYLAYYAYDDRHDLPLWTTLWPAVECLFYLIIYLPWSSRLQQAAVHPSLRPRNEREQLFNTCHSHIPDIRAYIAGWYRGSASDELYRENIEDWLLWAVFGADRDELATHDDWNEEIDGYIKRIEELVGHPFPDGRNPRVRSIRLTLDEVDMRHRPLIWYLIVGLVDLVTCVHLRTMGFTHFATPQWFTAFPFRPYTVLSQRSSTNVSYWARPHRSATKQPIVFLHGIGIGLWPYVDFFKELMAVEPDVGIILIELLPISMRITSPMPGQAEMVQSITSVLDAHAIPETILMTHSYGSVIAAHIVHSGIHDRLSAVVLVDPVALLLHLPDTASNFVYRRPRRANEHQLWYFASRDPGISHTLSRRFFWGDNILWRTDVAPPRAAVVLSERDQIMPASHVWRYLTGKHVEWDDASALLSWRAGEGAEELRVLLYKDIDHSQVFETKARRAELIVILQDFVVSH